MECVLAIGDRLVLVVDDQDLRPVPDFFALRFCRLRHHFLESRRRVPFFKYVGVVGLLVCFVLGPFPKRPNTS